MGAGISAAPTMTMEQSDHAPGDLDAARPDRVAEDG